MAFNFLILSCQFFQLDGHFRLTHICVRGSGADFEGKTGTVHIIVVSDRCSQVYHGVFVGTIEGTKGGCVFALIGPEADGEGCFVIGIKIQGMEGCQGSGTGTDAVDVAANLVDAAVHFVHAVTDVVDRSVELAFIDGVAGFRSFTDVVNGIPAHVDVAILDGNVFRRIGIIDRQAVVVDRRISRADGVAGDDRLVVAGTDGDAGVEFRRIEAF